MDAARITVRREEAGVRLDLFLSRRLDGVSRSHLQRLIGEGNVLLNGKRAVKRQNVAEGDIVDVHPVSVQQQTIRPAAQDIPLEILYEDEFLIAVNKPAGLVVHPGHGTPDGTLVNALLFRGSQLSEGGSRDRPGIVHRLDKETSGVVLIAKNNGVHTRLADAFAKRSVAKQYLGICIGRPTTESGSIELPLDRSRREPVKRAVSARGKKAITVYELFSHRCGVSVMHFFPRTGRTHQIRVHCSAAGFPILADPLYGGGRERILRIDPVDRPFAYGVYKCFGRQALHALKITFKHPETDVSMTIRAPLPDDFRTALLAFGDSRLFAEIENS
ncbi:MAG: RluA family pseudouridine synthase [Chitinispirillaceae bacterium]|nr:RluA family pseudouridine synthase [Chitinispirillaceae bacterium]